MEYSLSSETVYENLLKAEYAVRGELAIKAESMKQKLSQPNNNLPFDKIVACNIGNPQALNQKPLSFNRQVICCIEYPALLDEDIFPADVKQRAKEYMAATSMSGTGAYTSNQGIPLVRKQVANFIQERDNYLADANTVFLTDGASSAIQRVLRLLIRNENDAIMIPSPGYPLYSASITFFGGKNVSYDLEEETGWSLKTEELKNSYEKAKKEGFNIRALAVINPGNPTGQCLSKSNIIEVVKFCEENDLAILADEVYQENSYNKKDKPFHSFKKIVRELDSSVGLCSFHSISKGFNGECGHRGGYAEIINVQQSFKDALLKLGSISLCSNTVGQILIGLMVNPPKKEDPSFQLFEKEKNEIYNSLKERAHLLNDAFCKLEGVTSNEPEGAMYLFPKIEIPKKAIEHAKSIGKLPDTFYCLELLENTGIVIVPGSGFGQKDGTYHFRTTFLPQKDLIEYVVEKMTQFHTEFLEKFK